MKGRERTAQRQHAIASRAFDEIAADYDAAYGHAGTNHRAGTHHRADIGHRGGNAAMAWMRRENLALLEAAFPIGSRLLEVGCGTGDEAIALALGGRAVLATDISPAMAALAAQKAARAGIADRVRAVALAGGTIAALHPTAPFDGAYASFGGLNCEPDLECFGRALARLVRPGGAVVCGVMGRHYLFEIAWYLAHARPRRALRRMRRGWRQAPVAGVGSRMITVATRYLGHQEMQRALGEAFTLERTRALPLLMPPPYAASLYRRYPALVARLAEVDRTWRDRWPWRLLGDHLVMVFRHR
jgi:SAM-dependent methyltransferase